MWDPISEAKAIVVRASIFDLAQSMVLAAVLSRKSQLCPGVLNLEAGEVLTVFGNFRASLRY